MDYTANVKHLVRSLSRPSGAPLACLVVMVALRDAQPVWEIGDLVSATGYEAEAVKKARRVLIDLGLAAGTGPAGRYGLRLTDAQAAQLPLGDLFQPDSNSEVGKTYLPHSSSSSSSSIQLASEKELPLLPPQTDGRSEKPTSRPEHPDLARLAEILCNQIGGVDRSLARQAVQQELDRDYSANWIEHQILKWWAYAESPRGQSIHAVGRFVARKIEHDETAPYTQRPSFDRYHEKDWNAWSADFQTTLYRIEELDRQLKQETEEP